MVKIDEAHKIETLIGGIDFATKPKNSDGLFHNVSHNCTLKSITRYLLAIHGYN